MVNKIKGFFLGHSNVSIIGIIFISFVLGMYYSPFFVNNIKRSCLSNLSFINPEPGCEVFEEKLDRMEILQNKLNEQVDIYLKNKKISRISVFTRNLTTRRFAGVNDGDEFFMASLLKVPLAVAYFRLSEITPDVLGQEITYTGKPDLYSSQSFYLPKEKLIVGTSYTVKNLLEKSLAYSDNTASELLSQNFVSYDYLQKILQAVGLKPKNETDLEYLVTARSYANTFRALYNSSFITRKSSNEILSILSKGILSDGAIAKLPKDITVAHKFGERTVIDSETKTVVKRQLHDCGIVYTKNAVDAYTFCILTEGYDFLILKLVLQNISETIYKEIVE